MDNCCHYHNFLFNKQLTNEEDRRVVANQIPDAIVGVEFHSESAWISHGVGRATFATYQTRDDNESPNHSQFQCQFRVLPTVEKRTARGLKINKFALSPL
jgi:hypothetical protein